MPPSRTIKDLEGVTTGSATTPGVRLKHFERVVASLLPVLSPSFVDLPPVPPLFAPSDIDASDGSDDNTPINWWPYNRLPPAARVYGTLPGQLSDWTRAKRKEEQVRSMLRCILALIPTNKESQRDESLARTVVDFGGGSGHVSIPLALLASTTAPPDAPVGPWTVICVDLGARSLELLHQKAAAAVAATEAHYESNEPKSNDPPPKSNDPTPILPRALQPTAIANLWTYCGSAESWHTHTTKPFDMAVALHLCGEATDVVLHMAAQQSPHCSLVVAPCCVGKLSNVARNPYVYQATGSNVPTIQYPQSDAFVRAMSGRVHDDTPMRTDMCLPCGDVDGTSNDTATTAQHDVSRQADWNALAKAADFSNDRTDCRTMRHATRRTAKALLEWDRIHMLQERYGYTALLTRMEPWEASPKHDILLAWHQSQRPDSNDRTAVQHGAISIQLNQACQADIEWTMEFLLSGVTSNQVSHSKRNETNLTSERLTNAAPTESTPEIATATTGVDWTAQEVTDVRRVLTDFVALERVDDGVDGNVVLVFPTRMGGRQRKLVHFLAGQMGLAHWCQGKKHADKTVAVAAKGRRQSLPDRIIQIDSLTDSLSYSTQ